MGRRQPIDWTRHISDLVRMRKDGISYKVCARKISEDVGHRVTANACAIKYRRYTEDESNGEYLKLSQRIARIEKHLGIE